MLVRHRFQGALHQPFMGYSRVFGTFHCLLENLLLNKLRIVLRRLACGICEGLFHVLANSELRHVDFPAFDIALLAQGEIVKVIDICRTIYIYNYLCVPELRRSLSYFAGAREIRLFFEFDLLEVDNFIVLVSIRWSVIWRK